MGVSMGAAASKISVSADLFDVGSLIQIGSKRLDSESLRVLFEGNCARVFGTS